jgi:protein tyrosine phosphatase (PTP) superfamily phosphohydrolase (DUF442 family)
MDDAAFLQDVGQYPASSRTGHRTRVGEFVGWSRMVNGNRSKARWLVYVLGSLLGLAAIVCGLGIYTGLLGDNFRVVSPHKCYRSGQLPPETLKRYIREHGIRCVVNLRGDRSDETWYTNEVQTCRELGCVHASYAVSTYHLVPPKELEPLATRLEEGPYPMLLHCRRGADRAALASALYLMIVEHKTLDEALDSQLTWRYGHVKMGDVACIDEFFELYRTTSDGRDIKTWIKEVYPELYLQRYPHGPPRAADSPNGSRE